jgi:hypothetical protein
MENELFAQLYQHVHALPIARRPREAFTDHVILLVYFWAVLHDRPTCWACRPGHWPLAQRRWKKPSQSGMSRRLRRPEIRERLRALERGLRAAPADADLIKCIDAKPLVVSPYAKDADATWGHVGKSAKGKGFKLFALADRHGILAWEVGGLGTSELSVAPRLLAQLDGGGYLLGDAWYDTHELHGIAGLCNHRLIAPRKKPGTGLGRRAHHPQRRRCIDLLERAPTRFGIELYQQRTRIERHFGRWSNVGGGLGPLSNWVRTLPRVRRWIHAKLIIHALRMTLQA